MRDTIARIESFVLTGLEAGDAWAPAYGFVVKVLAIVKKAGIAKLGLVTDPLASE